MEVNINKATDQFEERLIELVNTANLPFVNIELVMSKILNQVTRAKESFILAEEQKQQAETEKEKEDTDTKEDKNG